MYGEVIEFENGTKGMALNLEQDSVGAVVLGDYLEIIEGQKAVCNGGGIADGACDCDGNVLDCAGDCGGSAVEDNCGVCGGSGAEFECEDGSLVCNEDDCSGGGISDYFGLENIFPGNRIVIMLEIRITIIKIKGAPLIN